MKPVEADDLLERFREAQTPDGHEPDTWKKIELTLQEDRPLLVGKSEPRPWLVRGVVAAAAVVVLALAAWFLS